MIKIIVDVSLKTSEGNKQHTSREHLNFLKSRAHYLLHTAFLSLEDLLALNFSPSDVFSLGRCFFLLIPSFTLASSP